VGDDLSIVYMVRLGIRGWLEIEVSSGVWCRRSSERDLVILLSTCGHDSDHDSILRAEELADGQRKIVEEEKRAHDALKKCLEEEARKVEAAQREVVEARGEAEVWKDAVERLREEVCDAVDAASSELEMEVSVGCNRQSSLEFNALFTVPKKIHWMRFLLDSSRRLI